MKDTGERLQKLISRAGLASRRTAEQWIAKGRVMVNGRIAVLGQRADPELDLILVGGQPLIIESSKITIVLHKPRGYVTTLKDPEGRPIVADLIQDVGERLFPVGRLDYHSEGLLIMTNDGDLAQLLAHPRSHVPRTYRVKVKGRPGKEALDQLRSGVKVQGWMTAPADVEFVGKSARNTWLLITLYEGRNQQIRRMCAKVGHGVQRLIRVSVGPLELGDLPPGRYRRLTKKELGDLKRAAMKSGSRPEKRK